MVINESAHRQGEVGISQWGIKMARETATGKNLRYSLSDLVACPIYKNPLLRILSLSLINCLSWIKMPNTSSRGRLPWDFPAIGNLQQVSNLSAALVLSVDVNGIISKNSSVTPRAVKRRVNPLFRKFGAIPPNLPTNLHLVGTAGVGEVIAVRFVLVFVLSLNTSPLDSPSATELGYCWWGEVWSRRTIPILSRGILQLPNPSLCPSLGGQVMSHESRRVEERGGGRWRQIPRYSVLLRGISQGRGIEGKKRGNRGNNNRGIWRWPIICCLHAS